jgi:predicted ATP-dependent endonuclease of OLD family
MLRVAIVIAQPAWGTMHIEFLEIANFRKLLSTRVDFSTTTTLFVGANNSGKTSAMLALRRFLSPRRCPFEIHDFTLCHWSTIIALGESWLIARNGKEIVDLVIDPWVGTLPTLDLWLHVDVGEIYHVRNLIPSLDWEGGRLGVRLRYEPKDVKLLYKDFLAAVSDAEVIRAAADSPAADEKHNEDAPASSKLTIWPENLIDFLSRRLSTHFTIQAYSLDPTQLSSPVKSLAKPQALPAGALPIEGDPLSGLIRVHDIPAQRGFGEEQQGQDDDDAPAAAAGSRLSEQLKSYYAKHLDPTKGPDPKDLGALQAIEAAQDAFDKRLTESFKAAFTEVEDMGYPGVTDPRPRVSTRLRAIDGLNHSAAISFEVDVIADVGATSTPLLRLPEANNGLGYQNLISMIFRLMSFRDAWMRVGKASKAKTITTTEPLHLVLVEEPEAHLHAQVQQVFIKKAYDVLRAHDDLKKSTKLRTQLVVSTHSSHVAHETSFSCLRYFRRLPAGMVARVPVSTVINLSEVFGPGSETERFVTRYLRAQHADLFFADAAILVEGPAERMLVPNFIRNRYDDLNKSYITLLEIGGSHAHRLKPLIDHLGLLTLIITDLDTLDVSTGASVQPARGAGQKTNNSTLKTWVPALEDVDALLDAKSSAKALHEDGDPLFAVRAAYQIPIEVTSPGGKAGEIACPYTFEDALALENLDFFSKLKGTGLIRKFRDAIVSGGGAAAIGNQMYEALKGGKKAEFALDIMQAENFDDLIVPRYIAEGLEWLLTQLKKKQVEVLPHKDAPAEPEPKKEGKSTDAATEAELVEA